MGDVDATLDEDKALALADNGGDLKVTAIPHRSVAESQLNWTLCWVKFQSPLIEECSCSSPDSESYRVYRGSYFKCGKRCLCAEPGCWCPCWVCMAVCVFGACWCCTRPGQARQRNRGVRRKVSEFSVHRCAQRALRYLHNSPCICNRATMGYPAPVAISHT